MGDLSHSDFDDVGPRRGLYYDAQGNPSLEPPGTYGFCAGSTEDEINRAHEALKNPHPELDPVFKWDPGRHKDAKNPTQCEIARLTDLATDRWYRESPLSLLKNIGAGVINAVVPGSDLGDAGSSTQIVGQLIGGVVGTFVNPAALVSKISQLPMALNLGSIGSAILNGAKSVLNFAGNPVGSLITGAIANALLPSPTPIVSMATATGGTVAKASTLPFTSSGGSVQASNAAFSSQTSSSIPMWVWIVLPIALLFLLFLLFKKR